VVHPSALLHRGFVIRLDKLWLFQVRRAEVKLPAGREQAMAPQGQYCLDIGNVAESFHLMSTIANRAGRFVWGSC
jgi:hypothetical protein